MYNLQDTLFAGLQLHNVTKETVWAVLLYSRLRPVEEIVFGIDSEDHFEAFRTILLGKDTFDESIETNKRAFQKLRRRIVQINAAAGSGQRLNRLVKKYAPAYANWVRFSSLDEYALTKKKHR